jgi:hypothetical protein
LGIILFHPMLSIIWLYNNGPFFGNLNLNP